MPNVFRSIIIPYRRARNSFRRWYLHWWTCTSFCSRPTWSSRKMGSAVPGQGRLRIAPDPYPFRIRESILGLTSDFACALLTIWIQENTDIAYTYTRETCSFPPPQPVRPQIWLIDKNYSYSTSIGRLSTTSRLYPGLHATGGAQCR